jgi:hypothetical protein
LLLLFFLSFKSFSHLSFHFPERRNFWKINAEKNDMVAVLLQHIESNAKLRSYLIKNQPKTDKADGNDNSMDEG